MLPEFFLSCRRSVLKVSSLLRLNKVGIIAVVDESTPLSLNVVVNRGRRSQIVARARVGAIARGRSGCAREGASAPALRADELPLKIARNGGA
jgi:hypothetical protein